MAGIQKHFTLHNIYSNKTLIFKANSMTNCFNHEICGNFSDGQCESLCKGYYCNNCYYESHDAKCDIFSSNERKTTGSTIDISKNISDDDDDIDTIDTEDSLKDILSRKPVTKLCQEDQEDMDIFYADKILKAAKIKKKMEKNARTQDFNVGREEVKENLQTVVKKIRRTNNQILEDKERVRLVKDQKAIIKQKEKENKEVC